MALKLYIDHHMPRKMTEGLIKVGKRTGEKEIVSLRCSSGINVN